ncbi:MAG: homocysteine S-methyltransferase family protein [Planctomycetes bacterium]|nr:homocysteine S-methyltransferase family protein [Planctomycetota bacterium]
MSEPNATRADLCDRLARGPLVLDGATGTELTRRGVDTALPLWSATALTTAPDMVQKIHRDYVEAGADIIVANTFRTSVRTLQRAGRFGEGAALNKTAVDLARRAIAAAAESATDVAVIRPRRVLVAASVAPVEDCYRPELVPDEKTLIEEHAQMMVWLSSAGPDLVWIETMNTVREARTAAAAAADAKLSLVVSFVVNEAGDLLNGERLVDAVAAIEPFDPLAVGLNCIPPAGMTAHLPRLRQATERPLAAYAHIGNPEPILGWSFSSDISPKAYADHARCWLDAGVNIVGGCCGTGPDHIRAVRALFGDSG